MPRSRKGHRQPSSPPAIDAIPATTTGLRTPTRRAPIANDALIRPRAPMGKVSAMSDPCTGIEFDFAIPAPRRDQKSWNALATKPARRDEGRERQVRPAEDRRTPVAVRQPPHGQGAEHQKRSGRGREEDDRRHCSPRRHRGCRGRGPRASRPRAPRTTRAAATRRTSACSPHAAPGRARGAPLRHRAAGRRRRGPPPSRPPVAPRARLRRRAPRPRALPPRTPTTPYRRWPRWSSPAQPIFWSTTNCCLAVSYL